MFFQRFKHFGSRYPLWARAGAIVALGASLIIPGRFGWSTMTNRGADPVDSSATARPRFIRSDAWFLAALAECGSGPIPLARIIARGDAMQHAILERAEVNGALGRLGRAGYVTRHADGTIEMTEAGRTLVGDMEGVGLMQWPDKVESRLGSRPWSEGDNPQRAAEGEAEQVSQAEYDAAIASYTSGRITR